MDTENERKLDVFCHFRQFFHILTIFSWKNFRNQDRQSVRKNLAIGIGSALLQFGLLTAILGAGYSVYKRNFDLTKTALAFALMFTGATTGITYITMGSKHKQVADVIAGLVEKIDRRKSTHVRDNSQ